MGFVKTVDERVATKEKVSHYAYYIMIGMVSVLATFVPPLLLGAVNGDVGLNFPTTVEGWILWAIVNTSTAIANISILILFKLQAKKNCLNHPNYIQACYILDELNNNKVIFIPRSPSKMNRDEYIKKIICILVTTLGSFIAITSLMLSFDIYTLMSTLLSVIITVILSWNAMLNNEQYWTEEYLLYAKWLEQNNREDKEKHEVDSKEVF